MANATITPQVITRESLMLLENEFVMTPTLSRAHRNDFKKIGNTLYVRKPVRFEAREGRSVSTAGGVQDVEEAWVPVSVLTQRHVAWKFNAVELTMTIEEYSDRYIRPAMSALAHEVEYTAASQYKKVYHSVGTPGTLPSTTKEIGSMGTLLTDHGVPKRMRYAQLDTDTCLEVSDQVRGVGTNVGYGPEDLAKTALQEAKIGRIGGFDCHENAFINSHTTGSLGGTPAVNGASQDDTYANTKNTWTQTLVIDGATASQTGWALEGDVFTIAGLNSINPATKESTGKSQDFVVRADADSDGSGNVTLTISPPIITSGPYKTVDAAPADNALLTFLGSGGTSYDQNLGYQKDAFSFGMIPLVVPDAVVWGDTRSYKGISLRVYKWLDGDEDEEYIRVDAHYFIELVHHDMAVRQWAA